MIRIRDTLAGERVYFNCAENRKDLYEIRDFIREHKWLGFDTESTGLNCYRPGWKLRTAQWGDDCFSYVVPARFRQFINWAIKQPVHLIGHNGPHDIRCIDQHLGYETGVACAGETYIPAHHKDSRGRDEGGSGHRLKDLAIAHVDLRAGIWESKLKEEFKKIKVRVPGEFYKSSNSKTGIRKGDPKYRKARLDEGWGLIDPLNPAYVAYAAADPILTYRLWMLQQPIVKENLKLYRFDKRVQLECDRLQRRAMLLDVKYTTRLNNAYLRKADKLMDRAAEYGCANIQSTVQIADTLIRLDAKLTTKTDTGKFKVDGDILRKLMNDPYSNAKIRDFIHCVLVAKQLLKRSASYTEAMLRERDENDRVHPSINSMAARTTRMSVSGPPLQQLPTRDREDELFWESENEI